MCMQLTTTCWMCRYGMDISFNGHVHSYERTFPGWLLHDAVLSSVFQTLCEVGLQAMAVGGIHASSAMQH